MKYLNTYNKLSESSHWKDDLIDGGKLSFNRKDSIEEVFYELMDNGYHVRISQELYDDEFNYPGKKIDFLSDNKNLYEGYKVAFNNNSTHPMDIDKIIENQEEEIIDAIRSAEKDTSGEIRVHIEKCTEKDPLERAKEVFHFLKSVFMIFNFSIDILNNLL